MDSDDDDDNNDGLIQEPGRSSVPSQIFGDSSFSHFHKHFFLFWLNCYLQWHDNSWFALSGCGWKPHQRAWNFASQAATSAADGMNWSPGDLILSETKLTNGRWERKCILSIFYQMAQDTVLPYILWGDFLCVWLGDLPNIDSVPSYLVTRRPVR